MRDNQRGSQNYMKNRRGMKEIEVSRRRKRGTQEERDRSTQLSVPKVFYVQIYTVICSQSVLCSPDTHKDSHSWVGKRMEKEEIEVF